MASTTITTVGSLRAIIEEARQEAKVAADQKLIEVGKGWGACGFAWVEMYEHNGKKIDGRSKMGKLLKAAGVNKSDSKGFYIWNPSGSMAQSVDVLEAGARAAADCLRSFGFTAYAGSNLD
jgi:hypothetical protein